ncbi:MAG: phosphate acyltransferase PlsX [Thermoanaerobaculia bacterium]
MYIAVDAMGGDFAPQAVVAGAFQAAVEDRISVLLVGDSSRIERLLRKLGDPKGRIEIIHAEEVVGMDEPAITPIRKKRRSSIRLCAELVRDGQAQAMVSAGNTGATMIASKMVMGTIEGVDRPALAAVFPSPSGQTVVLDVGANVVSKPAHLRQFAVMGHFYAQEILGTRSPRVGLLSIGEEEGKGTDLTREVFQEMKSTGFNFIGNVEGRDVFAGSVDVVVCEGFVGNVLLKSAESLAAYVSRLLRDEMRRSWRTRLGYLLSRPAFKRVKQQTDYRETGAAPLLGVQGGCFVGHGRSNPKAIRSSIRRAFEFCEADLHNKIQVNVAELHRREERLLRQQGPQELPLS